MSPNDMLIEAAVRRSERGALIRRFEQTDIANWVHGVGPEQGRVTTAVMLRNVHPDRPGLSRALALLADETARPGSTAARPPSPDRRADRTREDAVSYQHNAARGRR